MPPPDTPSVAVELMSGRGRAPQPLPQAVVVNTLAPPTGLKLLVVCPAGAPAGSQLAVPLPGGGEATVIVPLDVGAGQSFPATVQYQAAQHKSPEVLVMSNELHMSSDITDYDEKTDDV